MLPKETDCGYNTIASNRQLPASADSKESWLIGNSCFVELLNIICFFGYCYVVALMIIYTSWSPHSHAWKTDRKRVLYSGHIRRYCCLFILLILHTFEFIDYILSDQPQWYYILTPISALLANILTQLFYCRLECRNASHQYLSVMIIFWLACGMVRGFQFLSLVHFNVGSGYVRFWTAMFSSCLCYLISVNDFVTTLKENRKKEDKKSEGLTTAAIEETEGVYRYHVSNWYSRITFHWILPVLRRCYASCTLTDRHHFGKLPIHETSDFQYQLLSEVYNKQKNSSTNNGKVSLWKCYVLAYWKIFLFSGILKMLGDIAGLIPPLGISVLVKYVGKIHNSSEINNVSYATIIEKNHTKLSNFHGNGFVMAFIIFIASLAQGSLSQGSTHIINVQGVRLKNSLQAMIYSKLLKIPRNVLNKEDGGSGVAMKMISEDVNNIMSCFWIVHYVWAIPLKIMLIIYLLYREMGVSTVFGSVSCVIIMICLQYIVGKKMSLNCKIISNWNDKRMRKMNEVLQGIKLLKLYCWEDNFRDEILALRRNELKYLNTDSFYWAILSFLTNASSLVVALLTLAFHSWYLKSSKLEPSTLFTCLALFNQLTVPLFIFPIMVPLIISNLVSTRRLERFFSLPERYSKKVIYKKSLPFSKSFSGLHTKSSFIWHRKSENHYRSSANQSFRLRKITEKNENEDEKDPANGKQCKRVEPVSALENILQAQKAIYSWNDPLNSSLVIDRLTITKGTLNVIIGDVGSGKSSLIYALIGEMELFSGRMIWSQNIKLTYVGQNPWLLNTSIKENILFGTSYQEKRFKWIISACALEQDICSLIDKEETVVGERGVALSGGQKQRIVIARALYSNADVVVMDDPLSSVDSKVAEHIFECGIRKYISKKKKTVIFSTNSKKLILYANQIIFMKDCAVKATGNLSEICKVAPEEVCKWGMLNSFSASSGRQSDETAFRNTDNGKLMRTKSRSSRQINLNSKCQQQFWSPENFAPFIFTPLKRRLSTFSGSRYFAHDLPLPTDECDVEVFKEEQDEMDQFRKHKRIRAATVTEYFNSSAGHRAIFRACSLQTNPNSAKYDPKEISIKQKKDIEQPKCVKRHQSAVSTCSELEESTIRLVDDEIDDVWDFHGDSTNRKESNSVSWLTYAMYMKSCNAVFVLVYFMVTLTWQILRVITDLWLSIAASASVSPQNGWYLFVYGSLSLGVLGLSWVSTGIGQYLAAKARQILHERMLHNTLRCSVSFFENMLLGRIINVFSSDVDIIDKKLATSVQRLLQFQLLCLSSIVVNSVITPWFIVFVIPISLLYYLVQKFYRKSSKYLHQLENELKSPIISQVSETVDGLETIRVYCQEERFIKMMFQKLDSHTNVFLTLNSMHRWLGIILDYLGGLIVFIASLVALISATVYPNITSPALIGLAINYTLLVPIYLNWVVKFLADLEAYMIAVERIRLCIDMPTEDYNSEAEIPRNWPNKGEISYENVTLRYSLENKAVLQNFNVNIPGGQKVGICGRTGSGKSSLMLSLLKMVTRTEGIITFDGVDIDRVPLYALRSSISIIPQDTILFSGTIRDNIDLRREYSDQEIWRSLKLVRMAETVTKLGGLEAAVCEGGLNLSLGERQMINLARAVLYESICVILDEATSSLQPEFEKDFLHLAKMVFSKSTVIVITHRVTSLLDFDRILVLNNGKLTEDGSPKELSNNPSTVFYSMLKLVDDY